MIIISITFINLIASVKALIPKNLSLNFFHVTALLQ